MTTTTTTPPTTRNLETVGLTKSFGGVHAVRDATVTFHHGKINALIGPNGSGKTTFFNCVTGIIKPDSGTVTFRGEELSPVEQPPALLRIDGPHVCQSRIEPLSRREASAGLRLDPGPCPRRPQQLRLGAPYGGFRATHGRPHRLFLLGLHDRAHRW